jgi:surfactin synthase thioesterase subunit
MVVTLEFDWGDLAGEGHWQPQPQPHSLVNRPLLTRRHQDWCRATGATLLAVQPPGRALRAREPPCPDLRTLAAQLLPVVAGRLARAGRWYVVGHSVGAWAAYEFLVLARQQGGGGLFGLIRLCCDASNSPCLCAY